MNNVFPFKGECGKIQVSSDWEAEWYMLTKKLEIARLSIGGIQDWIITSNSQCQMWTVAPNLVIWTRQDSHDKTHTDCSNCMWFQEQLRAGLSPLPSRHKCAASRTPTRELSFQHRRSCRLYVPRYGATQAGWSPCKIPLLGFRHLHVGAHCLDVQPHCLLGTFVWFWDQGPGSQRDSRSLPLPSLWHLSRHLALADMYAALA